MLAYIMINQRSLAYHKRTNYAGAEVLMCLARLCSVIVQISLWL